MLFGTNDLSKGQVHFESWKERNLYCKFFAGYFFNDFVAGKRSRLRAFQQILDSARNRIEGYFPQLDIPQLECSAVHISFDNNVDQVLRRKNSSKQQKSEPMDAHGEFADVLLCDRRNNLMVAIEVKYCENWGIREDVIANAARLKLIQHKDSAIKPEYAWMRKARVIQCLLIREGKWIGGRKKANQKGSNYKALCEYCKHDVVDRVSSEDLIALAKPKERRLERNISTNMRFYDMVVIFWEDFLKGSGGPAIEFLTKMLRS